MDPGGGPGALGRRQRLFTHKEFLTEMAYRKLAVANRSGTRLDKLKTLSNELAKCIDDMVKADGSDKQLAPVVKQYRETIKEIEELEATKDDTDEISKILQKRSDDGKPGAVRKDRS